MVTHHRTRRRCDFAPIISQKHMTCVNEDKWKFLSDIFMLEAPLARVMREPTCVKRTQVAKQVCQPLHSRCAAAARTTRLPHDFMQFSIGTYTLSRELKWFQNFFLYLVIFFCFFVSSQFILVDQIWLLGRLQILCKTRKNFLPEP